MFQVLVPLVGACASLSAACLFAVWVRLHEPALSHKSSDRIWTAFHHILPFDLPQACLRESLIHTYSCAPSLRLPHTCTQHSWYAAIGAASSSLVAFTCGISAWQARHCSDTVLRTLIGTAVRTPSELQVHALSAHKFETDMCTCCRLSAARQASR